MTLVAEIRRLHKPWHSLPQCQVCHPERGVGAFPCLPARLAEVVEGLEFRVNYWKQDRDIAFAANAELAKERDAALERERVLRECLWKIARTGYTGAEFLAREALAIAPEPGREGDR